MILLIVGVALASIVIYCLPVIVALLRGHPDTAAISVTCLLFGWTFLGWGLALIWAVKSFERRPHVVVIDGRSSPEPFPGASAPTGIIGNQSNPFEDLR